MIDDLLQRTRRFLDGLIASYLKQTADDCWRWILGRAMRYIVSSALFIMAATFALLGGFEGLIVAGVPRYLAHLAIGTAALVAGYGTLKICVQDSRR
jgi:hypothetical protein